MPRETQIIQNQDNGDVVVVVRDRHTFRLPHVFLQSPTFQHLPPAAAKTLMAIGEFIDWEKMTTFVTPKRIANNINLSERHVRRQYAELIYFGVLSVVNKGGGRYSTLYRVNMTPVTPASRQPGHPRHGRPDTRVTAGLTPASGVPMTRASDHLALFEQEIINKAPPPSPSRATAEPDAPPPPSFQNDDVPMSVKMKEICRLGRMGMPAAQAVAAVNSNFRPTAPPPRTPRHQILKQLESLRNIHPPPAPTTTTVAPADAGADPNPVTPTGESADETHEKK